MTSTSRVPGDLKNYFQIPKGLNESEREVYQTLLEVKKQRTKPAPGVFVITDIAKDYDDLVAMILLKELHRLGLIRLEGFIANLKPAQRRAVYGRGALDALGLQDIPIAWGKDALGKDQLEKGHRDGPYEFVCAFNAKNCTFTPLGQKKKNDKDPQEIESGSTLLHRCVSPETEKLHPEGLTFLLISSLEDISAYIEEHEKEFTKGTARVVLQGGYKIESNDRKYSLETDEKAMNNTFHKDSAKRFYPFIAEQKIPSITYTKIAATAARMPPKFFNELADTGHVLGEHLLDRKVKQELEFYETSQGPNPMGGRDQEHYLRVRTNWYDTHTPEDEKPKGDEILAYVKLILYDVLAALDTAGEDVIKALSVLTPFRDDGGDSNPLRKELAAHHRIVGKEVPGQVDSQGSPVVDSGIDVGKMQTALSALLKGSLLSAVENRFGRREDYTVVTEP